MINAQRHRHIQYTYIPRLKFLFYDQLFHYLSSWNACISFWKLFFLFLFKIKWFFPRLFVFLLKSVFIYSLGRNKHKNQLSKTDINCILLEYVFSCSHSIMCDVIRPLFICAVCSNGTTTHKKFCSIFLPILCLLFSMRPFSLSFNSPNK